jgi:hypothetical protein
MIRAGVLVEVADSRDQPLWTKNLIGKIGLVIEPIIYRHSTKQYSVWRVLIEESVLNIHVLDLKEIIL